ncbi:N-6 DNA methylase, partial [Anaerolineales bacterium HSG25]|nr:N-6 DNA methylase [Anaerolineales bacterium HSG25]
MLYCLCRKFVLGIDQNMDALQTLIKLKLKLQDDSVAIAPNWTCFSHAIRDNLNIIRPDAVYHFNREPFILFFDFTKQENRRRETVIHRQVWCFDKAPIVFFIFDDEVQIYNAFRYQREHDKLQPLNVSDYEDKFSFWELQSGNTWQWLQDTFYYKNIKKHRVDQRLFDNIKTTRKKLTKDITPALKDTFANILILRLIFIRYLIDRKIKIDECFIVGDTLEDRKKCFNKLIGDKIGLNKFFLYLEDRFNGNLFQTEKDPEIAPVHLTELSLIFSAHKRQLFLFDVFDFSIISVETISGIYESIIDPVNRNKNSAVYTPSFLVDYILSQTVDKHLNDKTECRVLDPACGSGIFLVQTYRRMVEQEQNKDEEDNVSDEKLIELMQRNLFGVDKDLSALNVTAFSLYVALLDYKHPPEINKIKLPSLLNNNLFEADFLDEEATFNAVDVFQNKGFDFILGNPPWGSKKNKEHLDYIKTHKIPITRQEISQTFLVRTKDFSNHRTRCALIVTSKAFHNLLAKKYKNYFINDFCISLILDLSAVRKLVFAGKKNPAMILFYHYTFGQGTEKNIINYLSVKQNIFLKH